MTSAIQSPPNVYDFGYGFNYAAWTAGTEVTLVNVPWNNDYRDIVKFANRAALNTYINGLETSGVVVENVSYLKPNMPISLEIPFNAAYKYNYLRASNPLQPIMGDVVKDYYYFITDVQYVAPSNTRFILQLDVWQTFGFDATFGNCYIDRGHIGIANSNAFNNYGRDYLTIPEGIDTGSEYQIVTKRSKPIMAADMTDPTSVYASGQFNILIVSTVDLHADPGTADSPQLVAATGGNFFNLPSGASYYVFETANHFSAYLAFMQNFPWVTQGIISVTAIPPIKRYLPSFVFNASDAVPTPAPQVALQNTMYNMYPGWRADNDVVNHIPTRYRNLKKFFTFPYMSIELTTFTGTPIILKPESWGDDDAKVLERIAPVPPNQRVAISPYKYNATPGSTTDNLIPGLPTWAQGGDDYGEYIELATQINNFPSFAIVNNGAISYLAANAHGIAFQQSSADWSQNRAMRGNETSYFQASHGMEMAKQLTGIGTGANTAQAGIQNDLAVGKAIVGGIGSIVGGAAGGAAGLAGGAGSALAGGITTAMDIGARNAGVAVQNNAANASTRAQLANQGYARDTNKHLTDWSARGDYENAVAGISAKVQDAHLIQPTTSGQVGGESMNLVNNDAVVSMRIKMLDLANMTIVGEYWLRYGYAVHKFATPPASLMVMSKFTYWKLLETYIPNAPMPETFKGVIRGIFEKGVTVWANPDDIGHIDIADNVPLGGITL